MSKPFIARYPGWCAVCHHEIEVGDSVVFDDDKNVVHKDCADDGGQP